MVEDFLVAKTKNYKKRNENLETTALTTEHTQNRFMSMINHLDGQLFHNALQKMSRDC